MRIVALALGLSFTTTFGYAATNFGDFHRPNQITETGEATRTTTRQYAHSPNAPIDLPYVAGLLTQEVVTTANGSTTRLWGPDPATGFVTSASLDGITTTLTPDALGNVASATSETGKTTRHHL